MIKKWKQFNENVTLINDKIDFGVLTSLKDEINEVQEGDKVLATFFTGGYDTYLFTVERWWDSEKEISGGGKGDWVYGSADDDSIYTLDLAFHVVKLDTYNDFCEATSRITESFNILSKPIINRQEIEKEAYKLIEDAIDNVFNQLHQKYETVSGDISPSQQFELSNFQENLSKLVAKQVYQNISDDEKSGFESVTSESIDIDALKELTDERNEIKMNEEVIVVYDDPFEIVKFKINLLKHGDPFNHEILGYHNYGTEYKSLINKWYPTKGEEVLKVVKVETYNDFCDPSKRI